ncbi:MAG: NlpC/P60 family protein [Chitinispirillia bacterium]|nr:NlpC/P60 family protein [Chitinispirillia bacterium]MCL2241233.1 NlpC/P60 family protein [Chitinispirillia bacterium]
MAANGINAESRNSWAALSRALVIAALAVGVLSSPALPQSGDGYRRKMEEARKEQEARKQAERDRQSAGKKQGEAQTPAGVRKQETVRKQEAARKQEEPAKATRRAEAVWEEEAQRQAEAQRRAEVAKKAREEGNPAAQLSQKSADSAQAKPAAPPPADRAAKALTGVIAKYLGTPYLYGGTTAGGFDCSGFVGAVFRDAYNETLPRTSKDMWGIGKKVDIAAARPGDLVFFKSGGLFGGTINHVGIYMGNDLFVHSSTSKGVDYDYLSNSYYKKRFAGVRRVR